jgi:putative ATPase
VLPLSEATIYLARAPKSNSVLRAYGAARDVIQETGNLPVPLHLRNAVTGLLRKVGYGRGYRYAHDYEGGVVEQQHLPDPIRDRRLYEPGPRDLPS